MKVFPAPTFKKLPKEIRERAIKSDSVFQKDPYSRPLKTHKLKGKLSKFWSHSIHYEYRIVFEFVDQNTVVYHDIGTHEIYR